MNAPEHGYVDELIGKALPDRVPPAVAERLRSQLTDFRAQLATARPLLRGAGSVTRPARRGLGTLGTKLMRPINLAAIGAAAIVIFLLSQSFLSPSGGSIAFAQMQEQVGKTKSVQFVEITKSKANNGELETVNHVRILGNHLRREDIKFNWIDTPPNDPTWKDRLNSQINVFDLDQKKALTLYPDKRQYSTQSGPLWMASGMQVDIDLKTGHVTPSPHQERVDFYESIRQVPAASVQSLPGSKTIDGKKAIGFARENKWGTEEHPAGMKQVYWIDPQTKLPIRIEKIWSDPKINVDEHFISDFTFDSPLDPSLFRTEPPAGYTEVKETRPAVKFFDSKTSEPPSTDDPEPKTNSAMSASLRSVWQTLPAPALDAEEKWFNTEARPSLRNLIGKVVLLDFWGQWCGPCVANLPETESLYEKYKDRGLVVIGVHSNLRADGDLEQFLKDKHVTFPVIVDRGQTAWQYAIEAWPTYFLIDKTGKLAWGLSNSPPRESRIEELLNKPLNDKDDSSASVGSARQTTNPTEESFSFGPVIKRTIEPVGQGKNCILNLASGQFLMPPESVLKLFATNDWIPLLKSSKGVGLREWLQSNDVDLMAGAGSDLTLFDGVLYQKHFNTGTSALLFQFDNVEPEKAWNDIEAVAQALAKAQKNGSSDGSLSRASSMSHKESDTDTYFFLTRSGAHGVLQYLGTDKTTGTIEIRFKLVRSGVSR